MTRAVASLLCQVLLVFALAFVTPSLVGACGAKSTDHEAVARDPGVRDLGVRDLGAPSLPLGSGAGSNEPAATASVAPSQIDIIEIEPPTIGDPEWVCNCPAFVDHPWEKRLGISRAELASDISSGPLRDATRGTLMLTRSTTDGGPSGERLIIAYESEGRAIEVQYRLDIPPK